MGNPKPYTSLSDIPRNHPLLSAYDALALSFFDSRSVSVTSRRSAETAKQLTDEVGRTERILELLLTNLRTRRNAALSALSVLPPEMIAYMFEIAAQGDIPCPPVDAEAQETFKTSKLLDLNAVGHGRCVWRENMRPGSLGWVRLTHVCKDWRNMLCAMPKLWAAILGRLPLGGKTILKRANGYSPAELYRVSSPFHLSEPNLLGTLAPPSSSLLTYPVASQLRSLRIVDMHKNMTLQADWLPLVAWPNLEILEIVCSPYTAGRSVNLFTQPIKAPNLRDLHLQRCFLPWESVSLSQLSLCRIQDDTLSSATLYALIERSSDTLRHLELVDVSATAVIEKDVLASTIDLPHLQELRFRTGTGSYHHLLDRMKLPNDTRVTLHLSMEVDHNPVASAIEMALKSDIEAILRCRGSDFSLDGLSISPGSSRTEFILQLYCDSLSHVRVTALQPSTDPFHGLSAPLTLIVKNVKAKKHSAYLDRCLKSLSHHLDPARFATLFINMSSWDHATMLECMSLYTKTRILQAVNPLRLVDDEWGDTSLPQLFPFLGAFLRLEHSKPNGEDTAVNPPMHILETLWLRRNRYTGNYPFAEWCDTLYDELSYTLPRCHGWRGFDPGHENASKPIKFLRVDYLDADLKYDDALKASERFRLLADAVEFRWRTAR